MNHSTNIVWGERGELFLHEKALRAYFCTGVHIILARIVPNTTHQKFLFPSLGHYYADINLSVLSVSTCCAFKHFSLDPVSNVSSMTVVKVHF